VFHMSKLTDYGTVVMSALAQDPAVMLTAKELAAKTHVALPTVSKILKMLARAELVLSGRGAKGGYRLARQPGAISVADIIDAIEGPLAVTECSSAQGQCVQEAVCTVRVNWQRINDAIRHTLERISLAEMAVTPPAPAIDLGRLRYAGTAESA
jgi:FeS assembly SUF system regulator